MTSKSNEEIRAATVGELQPLDGRITLLEYDPDWPRLYADEATRLRLVLGDRALLVDHVGSTSVPGLMAKPIIDIVLAVPNSADEPSYVPDMESAGYALRIREPDWHEHRVFKGPGVNINLHVFSRDCPEIERMRDLRDWLRATDADRELYARTKRELAQQDWKFVQNYADAKTAVIEEVLASAKIARHPALIGDCDDHQDAYLLDSAKQRSLLCRPRLAQVVLFL